MKKKKHPRISASGRQKQKMTMRHAAIASMFVIIATAGIVYLNFHNPEQSVAANTNHSNTINYRSTDAVVSERYLRTAEQVNTQGRQGLDETNPNGKITTPSRANDVNVRGIQLHDTK